MNNGAQNNGKRLKSTAASLEQLIGNRTVKISKDTATSKISFGLLSDAYPVKIKCL